MKVAVIGVGGIGWNHSRIYKKLEEDHPVELVAFSRRSGKNVKKTQQDLKDLYGPGIEIKGYSNYKKMLDEEQLDAVSICSPDKYHLEHIRYALKRGIKLILCEKPLAPCSQLEQAKDLVDEVKENYKDVIIGINTQMVALKKEATKLLIKNYSLDYSQLEKGQFLVEWGSNKRHKKASDRIEDLLIHALSIVNAEPEEITEQNTYKSVIKCDGDDRYIILDLHEKKRRGWGFHENDHNLALFSFKWYENQLHMIYRIGNRDEEDMVIEDPLKTSLESFLRGEPLADLDLGLDVLVKTAKLFKALE